jgi:beta-barrel assembly-enhancing protease
MPGDSRWPPSAPWARGLDYPLARGTTGHRRSVQGDTKHLRICAAMRRLYAPLRYVVSVAAVVLSMVAWLALPPRASADNQAQDRQIGQQVYNDMLGRGQIVRRSPYYAALREAGRRVDYAARPHAFTMNFIIIKGDGVNAFSAPGGNVYVTEGLLRTVDNADELAAVLGHETGHLVLGHVMAAMKTQKRMNAVTQFMQRFIHNQGSQNTATVAGIVDKYGFLNFTRDQEYAADREGVELAAKAGYDPYGTLWFFQDVQQLYGDAGFEQYVQQHPSTKDRTARVERYIKSNAKQFGHPSPTLRVTSGLTPSSSGDTLTLH